MTFQPNIPEALTSAPIGPDAQATEVQVPGGFDDCQQPGPGGVDPREDRPTVGETRGHTQKATAESKRAMKVISLRNSKRFRMCTREAPKLTSHFKPQTLQEPSIYLHA